jgi:hypothetical protein
MKFDKADVVESICYQLRMADYTRSKNRALINNLFNGFPPYTEQEEEENNIEVNVNFLEGTRLSHDARTQFYQSMLKPGNFFTSKTDWGPVHKRQEAGMVVTQERNKIMKKSMTYIEATRSQIAMNVLHGIAPSSWRDDYHWCPYALGIEDSLVPSGTLLTMENLPLFAIYRSLTAMEMIKMTQAGRLDPAWNKPMLKAAIKWVDKESQTLMYNKWPEIWAPEKTAERVKGDGGFYYGDQCPTINVFDFYFWNDSGKVSGWNRRMILDAWSMPELSQISDSKKTPEPTRRTGELFDKYKNNFLYNPGDRKVAQDRGEIINWQFADLSAVAPFRYHSVRSLGFLLFSICHLQNRLRCKFNEAVFEQLMIYFRTSSEEDYQRALKVELANRGFIDDSVKFIPPSERYQVDHQLAMLGLQQNQGLIASNSASYTAQPQGGQRDNKERTKFEVMAEASAMQALVSAGLAQAYMYKTPEYREIARRYGIKGSKDPEVRTFQANCLRRGVSEKLLYNPECWEHEAERTLGAGNKAMEMAIVDQLMQYRNLFDPEPQREILRDFTMSITEDPARARSLVPENPVKITDSVHDAQLAAGTLMQGLPVAIKTGMNHIEYVDTLLMTLGTLVQQAVQQGMTTPEKLLGMMNMGQHIQQHLQLIAQDKNEAQRVKQYGDMLGKLGNELEGLRQRLQEQMQAQAQQGPQQDPETMAKVQAMMIQSKAKQDSTKSSHAQRTAQRQIAFEREELRKDAALQAELQREQARTAIEMKLDDALTANEIVIERQKAKSRPKVDSKSKGS